MPIRARLLLSAIILLPLYGCDKAPENNRQPLAEAARQIQAEPGRITPAELAQRLIADQGDFTLVDLRPAEEYATERIESARNLAITDLLESPADQTQRQLILYDEYGDLAARASVLLHLAGKDSVVLQGGWKAWREHLQAPAEGIEEKEKRRRTAAHCFFEGEYRADAGLPTRSPTPAAATTGGFIPPLTPASPNKASDALGLGLGLGPDPQSPPPESTPSGNAGLGLGLGLGLGPEQAPPEQTPKKRGKLVVGEGC